MTDKRARELGYIDATYRDLTAECEREDRRYRLVLRWSAVVLAALAGFLFFPTTVYLETGDDVFSNLYEWGNVPFGIVAVSTFAALGFFFGMLAYYITRPRD